MKTQTFTEPAQHLSNPSELVAARAPYVVEKLLMNVTVATRDEAEQLFQELLRYLWLCTTDRSHSWPMFSRLVDETWHQFVLFTNEYTAFCLRFFRRYMHHAPSNAPSKITAANATWEQFSASYRALYGLPPPPVWRDENAVCSGRRLIRDIDLGVATRRGKTELVARDGVRIRCDDRAKPALAFIAAHRIFYVRELPELEPEEQTYLCRELVASRTLRIMR